MAKRRRRHRGSAPADDSSGPPLIVPPVIFSRVPLGPRYFARPGAGGAPSRRVMVFIYAVIIGVFALCALGVILNLVHW